jgi:adenosylcobyric acid synthase
MLGQVINDPIESGHGIVEGLGLLPTTIRFSAEKVLRRPTGSWHEHHIEAYEIHHGVADIQGEAEPFLDGCRQGQVWGTMWHGAWENDGFRQAWLTEIAAVCESSWHPDPEAPTYRTRREIMINTLADAVEQHADLGLLLAGTRVAERL